MDTATPLGARQFSFLYVFGISIVVLIVVAALVSLIIYKIIEKTHTKEWLEAQKNRETKYKDVEYVAKEANLNAQEKLRLWHICRRYKAKNIRYLYRSIEALNSMFQEEYNRITQKQARNEEKINIFFNLRFKLENAVNRKINVNSTKGLKKDETISLYDSHNNQWSLKIIKTTEQGFYVDVPSSLMNSDLKPKPLDRARFTFTFPSGQAFNAVSRYLRYEQFPNATKQSLLISHSTQIKPVMRRGAKRMTVNEKCLFSSLKNLGDQKKPILEVGSKKYPGILCDISATGCKINCGLPINKGQLLNVYFRMPGQEKNYEAQGRIVTTKVMPDQKSYCLHIQFISIEQNVKNDIYSVIYGYS